MEPGLRRYSLLRSRATPTRCKPGANQARFVRASALGDNPTLCAPKCELLKAMPDNSSPSLSLRSSRERLQQSSDAIGFWWHSIDLGQGVVTPGKKTAALLGRELDALCLPSLTGKTVLDIGAWDGFYSFAAERRGAQRVVALDHYVWSIDRPLANAYHARYANAPVAPPPIEQTSCWQPGEKPGKRGFDTAHAALGSRVESVYGDFMTVDPAQIGMFDVVLFLGVLYHMENPLASLRRLAGFTKGVAIIETHAIAVPAFEHRALCEFYPRGELDGDVSNWWGPNLKALEEMCLAAGFSRVEIKQGPPRRSRIYHALRRLHLFLSGPRARRPRHYRAIVHAWK